MPEPKKIVYVAHKISGDVEANVKEVLQICREIHVADHNTIPFAPYLVALRYLDDAVEEERNLGMSANAEFFRRKVIDEVILCGPVISNGMKGEILLAFEHGIPVKCRNPELVPGLDKMATEYISTTVSR